METLTSNRIELRSIIISDKYDIFQYRSDPEVYKYQTWKPKTIDEIEEFINSKIVSEPNIEGTWMQFAVCNKDDNKVIGDCGIHFLPEAPEQVEIGITIGRANQGRGMASEALNLIFEYIFHKLQKHRIIASVDPENTSSMKLMEKMKMRKEAHFKKSILINGEWVNDVIYAILAEEWNNKK